MPAKPSLDLTVTVTDANGAQTRLAGDTQDARFIPRAISGASQRMSGFTTASFTLSRRIDEDPVDLHLGDRVQVVGADGTVAWEGTIAGLPRSLDDSGHNVTVTCAGDVAKLARRKARPVFVDRDLSAFTNESSRERRARLLVDKYMPHSATTVVPDVTGTPGVLQQFDRVANGAALPTGPVGIVESWYDAGPGNTIKSVYLDLTTYTYATGAGLAAPWIVLYAFATDDGAISAENSGNLIPAAIVNYVAPTATTRRYIALNIYYNGAFTGDGLWTATWRKPAVYCTTVPLVGDTDPKGVLGSDCIRYLLNTYHPTIDTDGIEATSNPIGHFAVRDRTTIYDLVLQANAPQLWDFAVWENQTAHYAPLDLSDWDWEIRHDDAGNQIGLQGDEITDLANRIHVTFTNVETGAIEELDPAAYPELRDDSLTNPLNQHGEIAESDYSLSWPTTRATALAIGRAALAELNQAKAPGSFTVRGHVKDRQGNWQPYWRVRAGDRIRLTSSVSLSDRPRPIHEVSWNADDRSATIAVDSTLRQLEALIDRVSTDLRASGLAT